MGRAPEQTLLPRRHTSSQQIYEKMINLTIREMQIKTTRRYSHLLEWPSSTRQGEDVEKEEPSFTVGGNVNWYRRYGK